MVVGNPAVCVSHHCSHRSGHPSRSLLIVDCVRFPDSCLQTTAIGMASAGDGWHPLSLSGSQLVRQWLAQHRE